MGYVCNIITYKHVQTNSNTYRHTPKIHIKINYKYTEVVNKIKFKVDLMLNLR